MRSFLFLLTRLVLAVATPALASDGVLEINQSCAMQTGCFDGDMAGFPVLITNPGSYVLTSNLSVADADTNGITIQANSVAIDLNGFEIAGPVTCTGEGSTLSCSDGTGIGISAGLPGEYNQSQVRRGAIRGFGSHGMELGFGSIAESLTATRNGDGGLRVRRGTMRGCTASYNGGDGIFVEFSTMTDSSAFRNRGAGIFVNGGSAIGNSSVQNGEDGFRSFANGTILRDNWTVGNAGVGIRCDSFGIGSDSCVITGNSISNNDMGGITGPHAFLVRDNTIRGNGGPGVVGQDAFLVQGNTIRDNGGPGVVGLDTVVVRNNTIFDNEGDGATLGLAAIVDGNAVSNNSGNGISVNSSSNLSNNALRQNGGFGLFFLGSQSAYRDNVISINIGGTVGFGAGNVAVNAGGNVCNGLLTCP